MIVFGIGRQEPFNFSIYGIKQRVSVVHKHETFEALQPAIFDYIQFYNNDIKRLKSIGIQGSSRLSIFIISTVYLTGGRSIFRQG
ncbi:IS3 family transposase [Bacillus chungangensis]|uniref:IS3 family transposase n=1 Tax=Bacillus chungangensis TaxID=587633 RepID=UPI00352221C9